MNDGILVSVSSESCQLKTLKQHLCVYNVSVSSFGAKSSSPSLSALNRIYRNGIVMHLRRFDLYQHTSQSLGNFSGGDGDRSPQAYRCQYKWDFLSAGP